MPLIEHLTPDVDERHPVDFLEPEDDDGETEALDVAGIGVIPKNALRVFCEFVLVSKKSGKLNTKATLARVVALGHSLDVCDLRRVSLTSLAHQIGCSRALLSIYQCELRDFAELSCHGGKSLSARETYSERASAAWTRRRAAVGESEGESVATAPRRSSTKRTASGA